MGKKGRNSSFGSHTKKWQANAWQTDLQEQIEIARSEAYDSEALRRKQLEDDLLARKRRTYGHLRVLIESRLSCDDREQKGDRSWITTLTSSAAAVKQTVNKKHITAKTLMGQDILQVTANASRNSNAISSLSDLALEMIVENLEHYDAADLERVFRCLPPEITERFSHVACRLSRITDDNITMLSNTKVHSLTIGGEEITDKGLETVVDSWNHLTSRLQFDGPEDWEQSALLGNEELELTVGHTSLQRLVLMNLSSISLSKGFASLRYQFPACEELILHGVDFGVGNASSFDELSTDHHPSAASGDVSAFHSSCSTPSAICSLFFSEIAICFPNLQRLHLSYCAWVTTESLQTVAASIKRVYDYDHTNSGGGGGGGRAGGSRSTQSVHAPAICDGRDRQDFAVCFVHLESIAISGVVGLPSSCDAARYIQTSFRDLCSIHLQFHDSQLPT